MKAAILEKIGAPLMVADIDLPEKLERGQVLVKVLCTGICGSQLQEIDGIKGDPAHLPHLLGHEGCGIVQDIGEGVTTVKKGDKVVMHWRKGAGIEAEQPARYFAGLNPAGEKWIKAGPITTFSECAIVSENRVTSIPENIPNDFAALLGCALSTALSVIEKEVHPRINQTILVKGCGGIGLCLIMVAIERSAHVIGLDVVKSKRSFVEALGAGFIMPDQLAFTSIVLDTVGILDTVGNSRPESFSGKYISLQPNGTSGGGFNPSVDIPRYVRFRERGMLSDYVKIITHRISLDQINDGIQLMRDGKAGRVMIEMQ